jgi:hypothetical protein
MCEYILESPSYYYQFLPGNGPTTVNMTVTDGVTTALTYAGGSTSATAISTDGKGGYRCSFDYSTGNPAGPNCCEGTYTLNLTTVVTDPASSNLATSTQEWTGRHSACLTGPAMDTQPLDVYGYPRDTFRYLAGKQTLFFYGVESPLKKHNFFTNLFAADYFTSTDYTDNTTWPLPFRGPQAVAANPNYISPTHPSFILSCLDGAEDVVAQLRLYTRSWTTKAQFEQSGGTGNADLATAEPSPFDAYSYADRDSWNLFTSSFPTSYPGFGN